MNPYQSLNLRLIATVAFCFAIGTYSIYGAPKIFAKSGIRELSARPFPGSNVKAANRMGSGPVDIAGAEQLAITEPSADNYINLSFAYWSAKQYRNCVRAARLAVELKPDDAIAYNNIAAGYQSIARWDSAIEASSEAIRLSPGFQLAQNNLAWELAHLKRLNENVAMTERSASIYTTSANYVQLSLAYYEAWRYQDCIAAANKALASRQDCAVAYNNICAADNMLGLWDSAIVAGNEALRIDPNFDLARNNLRFAMESLSEALAAAGTPFVMNSGNMSNRAPESINQILPLASIPGTSAKANGITLEPCYPNPASNSALIGFSLSDPSAAKLTLYDLMGREVQSLYDAFADPGSYSVTLNAASLPSGAYEYVLSTPLASLARSILISK